MTLSLPLRPRSVRFGDAETVSPVAGDSKGESSCIAALSIEPSGRWADYTPKPWDATPTPWADYKRKPWADYTPKSWADPTPAKSEMSDSVKGGTSTRRKRSLELSVSFSSDSGTQVDSLPSTTSRPSTTKSFHRLGTWDATPTPWSDPVALGFGFSTPSTPPPWAVPVPTGLKITTTLAAENEEEDEKLGSDPAAQRLQTVSEKSAVKGWNLPQGAYVPIKNTFIDGLADDLADEQPAIRRRHSAPSFIGARLPFFEPEQTDLVTTLPPPGLENVMDLPSIGSAAHATGQCRPCAWFHKPQGCHRGPECHRCHLCDSSEMGKRKKAKIAVLRAQDKGQKLAQQRDMCLAKANTLYLQAQELIHRANQLSVPSPGSYSSCDSLSAWIGNDAMYAAGGYASVPTWEHTSWDGYASTPTWVNHDFMSAALSSSTSISNWEDSAAEGTVANGGDVKTSAKQLTLSHLV